VLILIRDALHSVLYDAGTVRSPPSDEWARESTVGFSAALSGQVRPGVFIGAEARYLRAYEGISLNRSAGEALFLGPTFAMSAGKWSVMISWSAQVAGHGTDDLCPLDLTAFEQHQIRARFGMQF
jgi:hypothetical protein